MLERTYVIPLRREYLKVPKYRRAKKAVRGVREFIIKHMKSEDVLLGPKLNMSIWARGIKNPPSQVKVSAIKNDEGQVRVELLGFEFVKKEAKKKKEEVTPGLAGKLKNSISAVKGEAKTEEKPKTTDKKPEVAKPEVKKETPAPKVEAKTDDKPTKPETKQSETQIKAALDKLEKKTEEVKKEKSTQ